MVFELEAVLGVDVRFRARPPSVGEDWELRIDANRLRELVRWAADCSRNGTAPVGTVMSPTADRPPWT